jgi:hypothetical protein
MRRCLALPLLLAASLVAACGDEDDDEAPPERPDRAAKPPRGWRTVSNRSAGFTIAAPRDWTARTHKGATLIRSDDRLVVVTVAADRSEEGRSTSPARYARLTLLNLPEFEGNVSPRTRRVRGSPYRSARVDGSGTVRTSGRLQRITVAAFRRPDQVTYAAVAFRNPRLTPRFDERIVNRMLRTLRG